MVDPTHIKEYKEILEGEEVHANISEALISGKFRHAFTQINNHADIINNYSVGDESAVFYQELLNKYDLELAVLATLIDTASFHSTKGKEEDKIWIKNICNKK